MLYPLISAKTDALSGAEYSVSTASVLSLVLARTFHEWPGKSVSVPCAPRSIVRDSYDCRDAGGRAKQDARAEWDYGSSRIGRAAGQEAIARQAQTVTLRHKPFCSESLDTFAVYRIGRCYS